MLNMYFVQMSGRVSLTSSAVKTTAACLAAGSATTTMIAVITQMKTSVVGHPSFSYFWMGRRPLTLSPTLDAQ